MKVILNPSAGKGNGARMEPVIRGYLDRLGLDYDLVLTEALWHAAELAQQAAADGFEIVVSAGGDGTTSEVVNGLVAAANGGVAGTLGVIPLGSGCDFANTAGVPADVEESCTRLVEGSPKLVDIGRVSIPGEPTRYFDNTLGIGFDGVVTLEARKFKRLRGMALYLPVVLKTVFLDFKPPTVKVELDDEVLELSALMVVVANGPREGGGFFIAPEAKPDDGLFDICAVNHMSRMAMLGIIPKFMNGSHVSEDTVAMRHSKRIKITSPDNLIAHADGEMISTEHHEIEIEMLPRQLRVIS
jgi:diacylglycerol kinase (ATP)